MLVVGLDVHKDAIAAVAVDETGRSTASGTFDNTRLGHEALLAWVGGCGQVVRLGMESSGGMARQLAYRLEAAGYVVSEIQPRLSHREARRSRTPGKSDPGDALAIARVLLREPDLPGVRQQGLSEDLKLLADYRDQLFAERTRLANRLHADLAILRPGYQREIGRTLTSPRSLEAARRMLDDDRGCRAELARRRVGRLSEIDAEIKAIERRLGCLVRQTGTTLTEICGVGPLVAARILGEVGDARRFPNTSTFAAANGTAPIPASSGRTERHRLNRGGNRRLNHALYMVALTQTRHEPRAVAYLDRLRTVGKTRREALRCLKRQLSNVIYRRLMADAERD